MDRLAGQEMCHQQKMYSTDAEKGGGGVAGRPVLRCSLVLPCVTFIFKIKGWKLLNLR
jgi:hypothetical protein